MKAQTWRWAVAVSFANLLYLPVWAALLDPSYQLYAQAPPPRSAYAAALLGVAVLTAVVAGLLVLAENRHRLLRAASRAILFVLTLMVVSAFLVELGRLYPAQLGPVASVLLFGLVVLLLVGWIAFPAASVRGTGWMLVVFFPFALLSLGQAVWGAVSPARPAYAAKSPSPVAQPTPEVRVLWLVLDELDFRTAFAARPPGLKLPEFDRLRRESLFAERAYPPERHSMPALLTGLEVHEAWARGPDELEFSVAGGGITSWSASPDVFSRTRELGVNTGLLGFFLPYCRVLGDRVTRCSARPSALGDYWNEASFTETLLIQAWLLARRAPVISGRADSVFSIWPRRKPRALRDFLALREEAVSFSTDPALGLILVHLPVPHPPAIFDARREEWSTGEGTGYLDNLVLADRTLGELRSAMERAGLWESTSVLVTSDHALRIGFWEARSRGELAGLELVDDARVPFLLKLAHQTAPLTYEREFKTIVTSHLLLALLRGELRTGDDVAAWLDRRSSPR